MLLSKDLDDVEVTAAKILNNLLLEDKILISTFYNYNNNLVMLFNFSHTVDYNELLKYVNLLTQSLCEITSSHFISCISEIGMNVDSIFTLYKQCQKALSYKILHKYYDKKKSGDGS